MISERPSFFLEHSKSHQVEPPLSDGTLSTSELAAICPLCPFGSFETGREGEQPASMSEFGIPQWTV